MSAHFSTNNLFMKFVSDHAVLLKGGNSFSDIIYEDTGSPENSCDLRKEQQDRLFPLMGKGRFKMKPKGLLER